MEINCKQAAHAESPVCHNYLTSRSFFVLHIEIAVLIRVPRNFNCLYLENKTIYEKFLRQILRS